MKTSMRLMRLGVQACSIAVLLVAAAAAMGGTALAETAIKVGKAVPQAFSFTPLEIGNQQGIFKKHGLKVEIVGFQGGARMQQALVSDTIDIGVGPEFLGVARGAPNIAIAQMAGPPLLMMLLTRPDGPSNAAELKGKKVGVSGKGSLTHWLLTELSRQQGWGSDAIEPVGLGAEAGQFAALKAGQISGMTTDIATAYRLQDSGEGKIIVRFGKMVDDFITHVVWANKAFTEKEPDATRAFLAGWFETIKFMRGNKAETVRISAAVMGVSDAVAGKVYDELMPTFFSSDGRFNKKALETLAASFVEMGNLPKKVDLTPYYTEKFLSGAK